MKSRAERIKARIDRVYDRSKYKKPRVSRPRSPLWDLYEDGVTYTFLSNFLVDRERTRLNYVEGLTPDRGVHAPLEFGELFHACLESHAQGASDRVAQIVSRYEKDRLRASSLLPEERQEISRLAGMVETTFEAYLERWAEEDRQKAYIFQEKIFDYPYRLPSGPVIRLRGRWDAVFEKDGGLYLQENKTKGEIDEEMIQSTLHMDLQTMFYAFVLERYLARPVVGVLYNVVRRSLLRQGRSETLPAFLLRLKEDIRSRPDWYFYRWNVQFGPRDIENWKERTLDPLLEQVRLWWDSIRDNPFDPWKTAEGKPNGFHYLRPFGAYDPLAANRKGDYFELLVHGSSQGLLRRHTPFPELEDD